MTGATIKISPNDEMPTTSTASNGGGQNGGSGQNGGDNGDSDAAPSQSPSQTPTCLLPPSNIAYRRVTIEGTQEAQFKVSTQCWSVLQAFGPFLMGIFVLLTSRAGQVLLYLHLNQGCEIYNL